MIGVCCGAGLTGVGVGFVTGFGVSCVVLVSVLALLVAVGTAGFCATAVGFDGAGGSVFEPGFVAAGVVVGTGLATSVV